MRTQHPYIRGTSNRYKKIPLTKKQKKVRAASKAARKARRKQRRKQRK